VVELATETQDEGFWNDVALHLPRMYPGHFQNTCALDLKHQFDHLAWDLRQRSSPERELVDKPKLPEYEFSWQEKWILYCWGLELPLVLQELPEVFGDIADWKAFSNQLHLSPAFPKPPLEDKLRDDVVIIRGVFGMPDKYSVSMVAVYGSIDAN
jgi:hypothetical protein